LTLQAIARPNQQGQRQFPARLGERIDPARDLARTTQSRTLAMFARHITIQIQPGKMDEAIRTYRDSVVPASREQKGCRSMQLLTDAATGKCVSISIWDSEANQKASEDNGYMQQQIAKFGAFMTGPPVREAYRVSVKT
jgi:quinol monooxygenase YgiN